MPFSHGQLAIAAAALAFGASALSAKVNASATSSAGGVAVTTDDTHACATMGPYHRPGSFGVEMGCGKTLFYYRSPTTYTVLVTLTFLIIAGVRYARRRA
jgi:hypothetical protein